MDMEVNIIDEFCVQQHRFNLFVLIAGNLACEIAQSFLLDDLLTRISKLSVDQRAVKDIIIEDIIRVYEECDLMILNQAQDIVDRRNNGDAVLGHSVSCWNGKQYFDAMGKRPERAGSCAVVALIVDRHLYISHIGDSRAILIKKSAQSEQNVSGSSTKCDSFCFTDTFQDNPLKSEVLIPDSIEQRNNAKTINCTPISGKKRKNSKSQPNLAPGDELSESLSISSIDIESNGIVLSFRRSIATREFILY